MDSESEPFVSFSEELLKSVAVVVDDDDVVDVVAVVGVAVAVAVVVVVACSLRRLALERRGLDYDEFRRISVGSD